MNESQRELLSKARRSLDAATLLLQGGHPDFAAARAYYAMFYSAEAALEEKRLAFSKHSAVIAAFGREFAKPGLVPVELHRFLIDSFSVRNAGDYASGGEVSADDAREQIDRAERFVSGVARLVSG
jgi:uncharacterized protein (UPF0332 family)